MFDTTFPTSSVASTELTARMRKTELTPRFKSLLSRILDVGLDAGNICKQQFDGDACTQSRETRTLYEEAIRVILGREELDPIQEELAYALAYHAFNQTDQPGKDYPCADSIRELLSSD
ncbi:hypothetical protein J4410_02005 [Candidatus Woesearchaeota archaeon]|nr:hypothetical protein [Candidatus Woesearchaeota archaeon]